MDLKVGDKIRILEDQTERAMVLRGDVLEVLKIDEGHGCFYTEAPNLILIRGMWVFGFEYRGIGWEKVED